MPVDLQGCKTLLRPECETCNFHERYYNDELCKPCYFRLGSKPVGDERRKEKNKELYRSGIGIRSKFKKFGVSKIYNHGKHHIYLYINYPKIGVNFKFPPVPDFDCVEPNREDNIIFRWVLHHINKIKYDDRKINHCLCLSSEHGIIHGLYNRGDYSGAKSLMTMIANRNLQLFGESLCPLIFEI